MNSHLLFTCLCKKLCVRRYSKELKFTQYLISKTNQVFGTCAPKFFTIYRAKVHVFEELEQISDGKTVTVYSLSPTMGLDRANNRKLLSTVCLKFYIFLGFLNKREAKNVKALIKFEKNVHYKQNIQKKIPSK